MLFRSGVDDEATLGLAASINVIATAATAPNLRTIGIMAPPVGVGGSRDNRSNDDLTLVGASV